MITIKAVLERECKLQAQKWGYDYFISLDIDEYVISRRGQTIVDELHEHFNKAKSPIACLPKMNYQSSPHLLEPVNLLTIEAYQLRMRIPGKINYYMTVSHKCAFRLNASYFSPNASEFIATCCSFHGCHRLDHLSTSNFCSSMAKEMIPKLKSDGKFWALIMRINHYSRSAEKFALKAKTWRTASNEIKQGQTAQEAATDYGLSKFFSRNVGNFRDAIALQFSCQLREQLEIMTGEPTYLRPGDMWYRNVEFGRPVGDPDKRGRYGRPLPPGFTYEVKNPYHYHGGPPLNVSIRNGKSIVSIISAFPKFNRGPARKPWIRL
jgi:hypothetical protein